MTEEQKGKKMKMRKKKRSFSKLPNRRLQEVKGKTLLHWHVKVIHISANKLFRSSSQNLRLAYSC